MESLTYTDSTSTARSSRLRQARKAVDSQPSAGKTPESELMTVEEYFDEVWQRYQKTQEIQSEMETIANVKNKNSVRTSHIRHISNPASIKPTAGKTPESELMEVDEYFDILHKMVDEYYDSIQG